MKRVRELYKPSSEMRPKMEGDRRVFLTAMSKINEGMILGVDKNVHVERSRGPVRGPRGTTSIRLRDPPSSHRRRVARDRLPFS